MILNDRIPAYRVPSVMKQVLILVPEAVTVVMLSKFKLEKSKSLILEMDITHFIRGMN